MADVRIIGAGGPGDRRALQLATKKGNWIRNERRRELPPAQLRAAYDIVHRRYPGLELRSLSGTYNCFGMVFASRRTWISDGTEVAKVLSEDEYQMVTDPAHVAIGDIVVYRSDKTFEIEHAGVVFDIGMTSGITRRFTVLSQWGASGEYIHDSETVMPQHGSVREFYSERKSLEGIGS